MLDKRLYIKFIRLSVFGSESSAHYAGVNKDEFLGALLQFFKATRKKKST